MKAIIVSREIIKPSSPTPPQLRNHRLSFFDHQSPYLYLRFLCFYNNDSDNDHEPYSDLLKKSLSETLTQYYPFAGRLNDEISGIDCNDQGVNFLQVKCEIIMSELINNVKCCGIPDELFCDDLQGKDQRFNPLLSVQLTHFDCNGIALSVYMSHKIADAATFVKFIHDWSFIARDSNNLELLPGPRFDAVSLFHEESSPCLGAPMIINSEDNVISKTFEFDSSQIKKLKDIVGENVKNPTRVEVVTALIYKAAAEAEAETSLTLAVNLRTKLVPPLPETFAGNIVSNVHGASSTDNNEDKELWKLVCDMKRNLRNFCNKYPIEFRTENGRSVHKLHVNELMGLYSTGAVYSCSSWCRFPVYEVDFGWGKPIWVTACVILRKNIFLLMDTKDGLGIQASVNLETKQMPVFERNLQTLLSFYHLKP